MAETKGTDEDLSASALAEEWEDNGEEDGHLRREKLSPLAEDTIAKLAAWPKEWEDTGEEIFKLKDEDDQSELVALISELRSLHKGVS